MTTTAVFARHGGALYPIDQAAHDLMGHIKDGREVMVHIHLARNPKFHRLFFKALQILAENSRAFETTEGALVAVKYGLHEVDTTVDASTGEIFYAPRSISFASMPQDKFSHLFDRAIALICERWLPGMDREDLRQEIYRLVDGEGALGVRA